MESNKSTPDITKQLTDYIDTRIKLGRYKLIEKFTSVFAGMVTLVFVILCSLLAFLFASVTLAFYLSSVLESFWQGFGIVTLIYIFVAAVVYAFKDRFIEPSIVDVLINKLLKSKK